MNWKFSTSRELFERATQAGLPLVDFLVAREAFYSNGSLESVRAEIGRRIGVTRASLDRGLAEPQRSFSGLTDGAAAKLKASTSWPVQDKFFQLALTYAVAVNEVNACGGKIIAFPTAGSCGIVPGVLWAYRDASASELDADSPLFQNAFIIASAIGMTMTFLPSCAYAMARFTERFVFPTPPLPLATAMILVFFLAGPPGAACVPAAVPGTEGAAFPCAPCALVPMISRRA